MRLPFQNLAALGLIAIGAAAIHNPRAASEQFGLPTRDKAGLGFVRGCGSRDIALGVMLLLAGHSSRLPLVAVSLLGLADFFTVSSTSDMPPPKSLGTHFLGFVGALALAGLLDTRSTTKT